MSPPAQLRWHPSLWRAEIPPRAPIAVSAAFRGCVNCHKNVSLSVWRGALTRKSGYPAKEAIGRCFLLLFAFFFFPVSLPLSPSPSSFLLIWTFCFRKVRVRLPRHRGVRWGTKRNHGLACAIWLCGRGPER